MRILALAVLLASVMGGLAQAPLPRAHAHNDYEHARPLQDALDEGFGSIEADVWLVDGELLVAHDLEKTRKERTLERLYLDPLEKRLEKQKEVLPGLKTLILLVDIKSEAVPTYLALEKKIERYKEILTVFTKDEIKTNAVTIILSGNRPRDHVANQERRWVAIDGRLTDLAENPPRALIPLISDNWNSHFKWKMGPLPEAEAVRLKEIVSRTHQQGRILRFWATPDGVEAWRMLREAKVDLINTDKLQELAEFLNSKPH